MEFEKLYEENYKIVYYVCLKFFRNEEDAEDMTQNIFIKAFDKINTLADINKFAPWIRQIANRECINELQKRGRFTFIDENVTNEELKLVDDKQKNPEEIVVEDDVRDIILEVINELPQDQRIAIFLYYYQDMTVKEISEAFNCPEQTTRSRLAYARKNMKKEIEKLEDKGVKLRALNILPFLYCVFQAEEELVYADIHIPEYSNIPEAVLSSNQINKEIENYNIINNSQNNINNNNMVTYNVNNSINSVDAITTIGKKTILSTIGGKIAIGVVAAAVVIGGIVGAVILASKDDTKDNQNTIQNSTKPNIETQSTIIYVPEEIETDNGYTEEDIEEETGEEIEDIEVEIEYINNTLFGSNCIIYNKNQITIKDVLNQKEDIILPYDSHDEININYYNNDLYLFLELKDYDSNYNYLSSYIVALSHDGNVRYKNEKSKDASVIYKEGNLVYVDKENNLISINLSTGEEVYKIYLSHLDESSFSIHINDYLAKVGSIDRGEHYVYDLSNGNLIYELKNQNDLNYKDVQRVTIVEDTYIVYDIDEDAEELEGRQEKPIKKFTTYDINGNILITSEELLYINFNVYKSYILVTKEMNGQYVSGFFKSDMTPILDYDRDLFMIDNIYIMFDMDMVGNDNIGFVITKDMSLKLDYISSYKGTYYIVRGIDGKTYYFNMSGNKLVEIAYEIENENWFAEGIYNCENYKKLFYECNSESGEFNIYVSDGEKVYTGTETRDEYDIREHLAASDKYLIYLKNDSALIMNYETKQEYNIEDALVIEGEIAGVVNNKYYLYYIITEKDENTSTYSLKAYNLETKEIKDIYEKDLTTKVTSDASYIFKISDYGFIVLNNDGSYEINKLELE